MSFPSKLVEAFWIFVLLVQFSEPAPVQDSLLHVGRIPRMQGCYFKSDHFENGDRIYTQESCLNCTCIDSTVMCYLRVCPFVKPLGEECIEIKKEDDCCPTFHCPEVVKEKDCHDSFHDHNQPGCFLNGTYYPDGSMLPQDPKNPCQICYCIRNSTSCVVQECDLKIEGCSPIYKSGQCCPCRYNCSYDLDSTTIPPGYTVEDLADGCKLSDGRYIPDGEAVNSTNPCEHCYCMRNEVVCAIQECQAPEDNCKPLPIKQGQCCPDHYDCPSSNASSDVATVSIVNTFTSDKVTLPKIFKEASAITPEEDDLKSIDSNIDNKTVQIAKHIDSDHITYQDTSKDDKTSSEVTQPNDISKDEKITSEVVQFNVSAGDIFKDKNPAIEIAQSNALHKGISVDDEKLTATIPKHQQILSNEDAENAPKDTIISEEKLQPTITAEKVFKENEVIAEVVKLNDSSKDISKDYKTASEIAPDNTSNKAISKDDEISIDTNNFEILSVGTSVQYELPTEVTQTHGLSPNIPKENPTVSNEDIRNNEEVTDEKLQITITSETISNDDEVIPEVIQPDDSAEDISKDYKTAIEITQPSAFNKDISKIDKEVVIETVSHKVLTGDISLDYTISSEVAEPHGSPDDISKDDKIVGEKLPSTDSSEIISKDVENPLTTFAYESVTEIKETTVKPIKAERNFSVDIIEKVNPNNEPLNSNDKYNESMHFRQKGAFEKIPDYKATPPSFRVSDDSFYKDKTSFKTTKRPFILPSVSHHTYRLPANIIRIRGQNITYVIPSSTVIYNHPYLSQGVKGGIFNITIPNTTKQVQGSGYSVKGGVANYNRHKPILPMGAIPGETKQGLSTKTGITTIPGEGICQIGKLVYRNGQKVPSSDACKINCQCVNGAVYCDRVVCGPPPKKTRNCIGVRLANECCPRYRCGSISIGVTPISTTETAKVYQTYSSTVHSPLKTDITDTKIPYVDSVTSEVSVLPESPQLTTQSSHTDQNQRTKISSDKNFDLEVITDISKLPSTESSSVAQEQTTLLNDNGTEDKIQNSDFDLVAVTESNILHFSKVEMSENVSHTEETFTESVTSADDNRKDSSATFFPTAVAMAMFTERRKEPTSVTENISDKEILTSDKDLAEEELELTQTDSNAEKILFDHAESTKASEIQNFDLNTEHTISNQAMEFTTKNLDHISNTTPTDTTESITYEPNKDIIYESILPKDTASAFMEHSDWLHDSVNKTLAPENAEIVKDEIIITKELLEPTTISTITPIHASENATKAIYLQENTTMPTILISAVTDFSSTFSIKEQSFSADNIDFLTTHSRDTDIFSNVIQTSENQPTSETMKTDKIFLDEEDVSSIGEITSSTVSRTSTVTPELSEMLSTSSTIQEETMHPKLEDIKDMNKTVSSATDEIIPTTVNIEKLNNFDFNETVSDIKEPNAHSYEMSNSLLKSTIPSINKPLNLESTESIEGFKTNKISDQTTYFTDSTPDKFDAIALLFSEEPSSEQIDASNSTKDPFYISSKISTTTISDSTVPSSEESLGNIYVTKETVEDYSKVSQVDDIRDFHTESDPSHIQNALSTDTTGESLSDVTINLKSTTKPNMQPADFDLISVEDVVKEETSNQTSVLTDFDSNEYDTPSDLSFDLSFSSEIMELINSENETQTNNLIPEDVALETNTDDMTSVSKIKITDFDLQKPPLTAILTTVGTDFIEHSSEFVTHVREKIKTPYQTNTQNYSTTPTFNAIKISPSDTEHPQLLSSTQIPTETNKTSMEVKQKEVPTTAVTFDKTVDVSSTDKASDFQSTIGSLESDENKAMFDYETDLSHSIFEQINKSAENLEFNSATTIRDVKLSSKDKDDIEELSTVKILTLPTEILHENEKIEFQETTRIYEISTTSQLDVEPSDLTPDHDLKKTNIFSDYVEESHQSTLQEINETNFLTSTVPSTITTSISTDTTSLPLVDFRKTSFYDEKSTVSVSVITLSDTKLYSDSSASTDVVSEEDDKYLASKIDNTSSDTLQTTRQIGDTKGTSKDSIYDKESTEKLTVTEDRSSTPQVATTTFKFAGISKVPATVTEEKNLDVLTSGSYLSNEKQTYFPSTTALSDSELYSDSADMVLEKKDNYLAPEIDNKISVDTLETTTGIDDIKETSKNSTDDKTSTAKITTTEDGSSAPKVAATTFTFASISKESSATLEEKKTDVTTSFMTWSPEQLQFTEAKTSEYPKNIETTYQTETIPVNAEGITIIMSDKFHSETSGQDVGNQESHMLPAILQNDEFSYLENKNLSQLTYTSTPIDAQENMTTNEQQKDFTEIVSKIVSTEIIQPDIIYHITENETLMNKTFLETVLAETSNANDIMTSTPQIKITNFDSRRRPPLTTLLTPTGTGVTSAENDFPRDSEKLSTISDIKNKYPLLVSEEMHKYEINETKDNSLIGHKIADVEKEIISILEENLENNTDIEAISETDHSSFIPVVLTNMSQTTITHITETKAELPLSTSTMQPLLGDDVSEHEISTIFSSLEKRTEAPINAAISSTENVPLNEFSTEDDTIIERETLPPITMEMPESLVSHSVLHPEIFSTTVSPVKINISTSNDEKTDMSSNLSTVDKYLKPTEFSITIPPSTNLPVKDTEILEKSTSPTLLPDKILGEKASELPTDSLFIFISNTTTVKFPISITETELTHQGTMTTEMSSEIMESEKISVNTYFDVLSSSPTSKETTEYYFDTNNVSALEFTENEPAKIDNYETEAQSSSSSSSSSTAYTELLVNFPNISSEKPEFTEDLIIVKDTAISHLDAISEEFVSPIVSTFNDSDAAESLFEIKQLTNIKENKTDQPLISESIDLETALTTSSTNYETIALIYPVLQNISAEGTNHSEIQINSQPGDFTDIEMFNKTFTTMYNERTTFNMTEEEPTSISDLATFTTQQDMITQQTSSRDRTTYKSLNVPIKYETTTINYSSSLTDKIIDSTNNTPVTIDTDKTERESEELTTIQTTNVSNLDEASLPVIKNNEILSGSNDVFDILTDIDSDDQIASDTPIKGWMIINESHSTHNLDITQMQTNISETIDSHFVTSKMHTRPSTISGTEYSDSLEAETTDMLFPEIFIFDIKTGKPNEIDYSTSTRLPDDKSSTLTNDHSTITSATSTDYTSMSDNEARDTLTLKDSLFQKIQNTTFKEKNLTTFTEIPSGLYSTQDENKNSTEFTSLRNQTDLYPDVTNTFSIVTREGNLSDDQQVFPAISPENIIFGITKFKESNLEEETTTTVTTVIPILKDSEETISAAGEKIDFNAITFIPENHTSVDAKITYENFEIHSTPTTVILKDEVTDENVTEIFETHGKSATVSVKDMATDKYTDVTHNLINETSQISENDVSLGKLHTVSSDDHSYESISNETESDITYSYEVAYEDRIPIISKSNHSDSSAGWIAQSLEDDIVKALSTVFPSSSSTLVYETSGTAAYGQHVSQDSGVCYFEGKVYLSSEQIPREDNCEFCFCFKGDIICLQQTCPPPIKGCYAIPIDGFCCPRFHCPVQQMWFGVSSTTTTTSNPLGKTQNKQYPTPGCQIEGKSYRLHQIVQDSSNPCMLCRCDQGGMMQCDPQSCKPDPPMIQEIAEAFIRRR